MNEDQNTTPDPDEVEPQDEEELNAFLHQVAANEGLHPDEGQVQE